MFLKKKLKLFFDLENIKKPPQKVAYSWQNQTQNSPELHLRFINSFIQLSLLRSLGVAEEKESSQYFQKMIQSPYGLSPCQAKGELQNASATILNGLSEI